MQLEVGTVVEGKVTGITNFGAFVELPGGKTGMVHISEVAPTFVKEIRDFVSEGQVVKVKVLSVSEDGKVSLSIKRLFPRPRGSTVRRLPGQTGPVITSGRPTKETRATALRICSPVLSRPATRKFPTLKRAWRVSAAVFPGTRVNKSKKSGVRSSAFLLLRRRARMPLRLSGAWLVACGLNSGALEAQSSFPRRKPDVI